MLKRIELSGFKSFAKKGELSFEHPITAIVGPNGSGKSNAAEAFRFVLGEQGSKVLRVKKSTDLIWNGSHTLPGASRAAVRVILDNTRHALPIDFDEVVVERTVLKDGTNEYFINGSKVRLKDVQELLAAANVGSSGHHIISQGEADRVLGASTKERREMLEDALGLKSYALKHHEAERKLARTRENIKEADVRRREIVPQLKFLERQVSRIEERNGLRDELRTLAVSYLSAEYTWLAHEQEGVKGELPQAKERYTHTSNAIQEVRVSLQALIASQDAAVDTSGYDTAHAQVGTVREVVVGLRQRVAELQGQVRLLGSLEEEAHQDPSALPVAEVDAMLVAIQEDLVVRDDTDMSVLTRALTQAKKTISRYLEDLRGKASEKERSHYGERLILLEQEIRELQTQLSERVRVLAELEQEEATARASLQAQQADTTSLERDLFKLTAEYNEHVGIVRDFERRASECAQREQLFTENRAEVQVLLAEELALSLEGEVYTPDELERMRRNLERLKVRLEGYANLGSEALEEYVQVKERYDFLTQELEDLTSAESTLSTLITELEESMNEQFVAGLDKINTVFKELFGVLFGGGTAELVVEKPKPREEGEEESEDDKPGIEVVVQLPRKKVTSLDTLSGGERALASIALIFAMSQVNPPPFIILDETDAALDEANSRRYADMVERLAEHSQLILITHNRATMSSAHKLFGVTMGNDGVSQLLSVTLADASQYAK